MSGEGDDRLLLLAAELEEELRRIERLRDELALAREQLVLRADERLEPMEQLLVQADGAFRMFERDIQGFVARLRAWSAALGGGRT